MKERITIGEPFVHRQGRKFYQTHVCRRRQTSARSFQKLTAGFCPSKMVLSRSGDPFAWAGVGKQLQFERSVAGQRQRDETPVCFASGPGNRHGEYRGWTRGLLDEFAPAPPGGPAKSARQGERPSRSNGKETPINLSEWPGCEAPFSRELTFSSWQSLFLVHQAGERAAHNFQAAAQRRLQKRNRHLRRWGVQSRAAGSRFASAVQCNTRRRQTGVTIGILKSQDCLGAKRASWRDTPRHASYPNQTAERRSRAVDERGSKDGPCHSRGQNFRGHQGAARHPHRGSEFYGGAFALVVWRVYSCRNAGGRPGQGPPLGSLIDH